MRRFTLQQSDCRRQSGSSCRTVVILLVTAAAGLVAPMADAAPEPGPEHVLRAWSRASAAIVGTSKSAQQRAFRQHEGEYNSHQIALMNEFKGPVDADELLKRYRFTEVKRVGAVFRLKAVTRDDVERLFVPGFEVEFSDDAYLPISVQFVDTEGERQGESIALVTNPPQPVAAALDRATVPSEPTEIRVASAVEVEVPAAGVVQHTHVEFLVKQHDDAKRLQDVLNKWKANATRTKTMRARFLRFEYDHVFHIEKRSEGTLAFRAPHKARVEVKPSKIPPSTTSGRLNDQGNPYQVESYHKTESLIWWKDHCCQVSHDSREIDVFRKSRNRSSIRKASFGEQISDAFVDGLQRHIVLFGSWSPHLETDFEWSISKKTASSLHLKGTPQSEKMKREMSQISIILDTQTYGVRAMKYVDPGENSETVYVVRDVMINVDDDAVEFVDPVRFEVPELPGYRTTKHAP